MRRRNPLTKEDWSIGKIIVRILIMPFVLVSIMMYIMFPIEVISYLLGYSDSLSMPFFVYLINLSTFFTIPLLVFAHFYIPYWRSSMAAVRGNLSHRQLKEILQDVEFSQTGIRGFYVSDLWINANGVFIPRYFILGVDIDATIFNHTNLHGKNYWIRLINGRSVRQDIGQRISLEDIYNELEMQLPHVIISPVIKEWWFHHKNGKRLRQEWKAYSKSDGDVSRVIAAWSDFKGYYTELEQYKNEKIIREDGDNQ